MKRTIDTLTGKPFRWNTTVAFQWAEGHVTVTPARSTTRTATHLHPHRVPRALLEQLNANGAGYVPPAAGEACA